MVRVRVRVRVRDKVRVRIRVRLRLRVGLRVKVKVKVKVKVMDGRRERDMDEKWDTKGASQQPRTLFSSPGIPTGQLSSTLYRSKRESEILNMFLQVSATFTNVNDDIFGVAFRERVEATLHHFKVTTYTEEQKGYS